MRGLTIALVLSLVGCWSGRGSSSSPHVVHHGFPPLVVSAQNQFSVIPVGAVHDGTYSYSWLCTAPQANVTIAGITGGSIRIEIEDDHGRTVHDNWFDGGLVGAISGMTAPDGAPGDWRVHLTFERVVSIGAIDIGADLFDDPDEITIGGSYSLNSTYEYEAGWPAGPARVTLASAISLGVVRIRMWDGDGDLVMDRTNLAIFVGAFNGDSHDGAEGTWRIRIDIDAVATAGAITIEHP
jgi:hypothetical protein